MYKRHNQKGHAWFVSTAHTFHNGHMMRTSKKPCAVTRQKSKYSF
jgi:hypothetical protein